MSRASGLSTSQVAMRRMVSFFFSFFLPVLRLYATRWVMTDLKSLYIKRLNPTLCPLFLSFLLYLAAITRCGFWGFPLLSLSKQVFTLLVVSPFPLQLPRPNPMSLVFDEKRQAQSICVFVFSLFDDFHFRRR